MIRRFFAFVVLLLLVGAGLYVWKLRPAGLPASISAVGDSLDDVRIAASVKTALGLVRDLEGLPIEVSVSAGEVRLRGAVPNDEAKRQAGATAEAVPGVTAVMNALQVGGTAPAKPVGRSLGESLDDHALEVRVKLALSLRKELDGVDISVRAFRRRVSLAGEVARTEQRALAETVVGETAGVESVENGLRLRGPGASRLSDARAAAERAVNANSNLAAYHLTVVEKGHRLALEGRVRTGAERDLAGLLASSAAGVEVENSLQLGLNRQ
jgi:osmotically-inducible protein OsmY